MPRRDQYRSRMLDWSAGCVGGVSELGRRPNYARFVDNLIPRPKGAWTVRPGSRRRNSAALSKPPHSLLEWVSTGGTSKVIVGTGGGTPVVYEDTGSAYTAQTWPYTPSAELLIGDQLNGALWVTQQAGTEKPAFYHSTNAANTFLTSVLPKPASAPTFAADGVLTGGVTPGAHYYRVRWQYRNGSSLAGPVSAVHTVIAASEKVTPNANLQPGSPRTDFLGWRLERTKVGGTADGPFYVVADDLTSATSYIDTKPDEQLYYDTTDQALHGEPPHMDGIIAHKDRSFGWAGSTLYASQLFDDLEGTGLCNWHGLNAYNFGKDDGDTIQTVVRQVDRLVIIKRRSVWALDGDSTDSFRVVPLYSGMGGSGPRCAASAGAVVWFFGDTGLYRLAGNDLRPFGWGEVGHYVDTISSASTDDVRMLNYKGQYLLISYSTNGVYNNEIAVYDLRFNVWTHFTGWRIADMIVLSDGTLLFADPVAVTEAEVSDFSANPSFLAYSDFRVATRQVYVQKYNNLGAGQWTPNGVLLSASTTGTAVLQAKTLALDDGGCIVAYTAVTSGTRQDIYVQRLDVAGAPQWTAGGVLVTNAAYNTFRTIDSICSDGANGCIIGWSYDPAGVLRARVQRIDSSGAISWTAGGVALGATSDRYVTAIADDAGGCYVAWLDNAATTIVASRLTSAGAAVAGWALAGTVVETDAGYAETSGQPLLTLAGALGVIVMFRSTAGNPYVQLFNTGGTRQWGASAFRLNPGTGTGAGPFALCSDGAGGCIAVWTHSGTGADFIRASRVDSAGAAQWGADGALVIDAQAEIPSGVVAVSDGAGGVIVAWEQTPTTAALSYGVCVQRMNNVGARAWANPYVIVCDTTDDQRYPNICTDGGNGAIVSWVDYRGAASQVFVQRVGKAAGAGAWTANGVEVTTGSSGGAAASSHSIAFTGAPASEVPPADAAGYAIWIGMVGLLDRQAADATGGDPIPVAVETDWIDDGDPDVVKDFSRLETHARSNGMTLLATLTLDEQDLSATVSVALASAGVKWGQTKWGASKWNGSSQETSIVTALPEGLRAKRYKLRYSGNATEEFVFKGFTLDATRLPERRY